MTITSGSFWETPHADARVPRREAGFVLVSHGKRLTFTALVGRPPAQGNLRDCRQGTPTAR